MTLMRFFSAFRRARTGNFAMIIALCLPMLIVAAGGAIDYSQSLSLQGQLQNAVDAAAVSAISAGSPAYTAALQMSSNGTVPNGDVQAKALLNSSMAGRTSFQNLQSSATVTKTGTNITASLSATANYNTYFLKMIGISSIPMTASSQTTINTPPYLDFYLMLDVSGSMGLPSTTDEQSRLAGMNPDFRSQYPNGCTFACHFPGYSGYTLSRNGGSASNPQVTSCPTAGTSACIQLRLDAVGSAVNNLIQTANNTQKVTNEFRIGLYPFISYLSAYSPLTYSISGSANTPGTLNYNAANLATLLDTGSNAALGSGGTHFENAFGSIPGYIAAYGNGSSVNNRQPFIFLVTDGSQDNQYQWNGSWWGSNSATTLNASVCATIKNSGVKIAVLYIPYIAIQNPTSFSNYEDVYANSNIPNIPAPLQSCASTGFYFTANTPDDITTALNKMFNQAVISDRITN